jgi:hypothetical protein
MPGDFGEIMTIFLYAFWLMRAIGTAETAPSPVIWARRCQFRDFSIALAYWLFDDIVG